MESALRPYVTASIALIGACIIVATPVAPPPPDIQVRAVQLTGGEDVGLIVGGSGTPIPQLNDDYVEDATDLYISRILPGAVANSQGVFTPEGLSPIYSGIKSLPLDTSVAQGRYMLDTYIANDVHAGDTVAVYGESQSSTIAGFVMTDLQDAVPPVPKAVPAEMVKFVLVGDPSNPDGGLLERFDGLQIPSLQVTFSGATPPDTIYDTSIYTQEYDGFADFPKYPINFLADLNAVLGLEYVHPTYRGLTDFQLDHAMVLTPTEVTPTTYYMIPLSDETVTTMPLLRPLLSIPVIGKPLADLLNPDLQQIVNLGYENPDNEGWDVGQPNVPTMFQLFPPFDQVLTAIKNILGPSTEQGIQAFMQDISSEFSNPSSLFASLLPAATTSSTDPASLTDIINGLTGAFSQAYSLLLPTADIATALAVTLPTYEATLFADNVGSNLLDAIGLPIAASTGLTTLAAGIEALTILQQVQNIISDLSGIF